MFYLQERKRLKLKNKSPVIEFHISVENTEDIVLGKGDNLVFLKLTFSDFGDYMNLSDPYLLHIDVLVKNGEILPRRHKYLKFQTIIFSGKD